MNFPDYTQDAEYLQRQAETKDIRRMGNRVGTVFLMMAAVMTLWSFPLLSVPKDTILFEQIRSFLKDSVTMDAVSIVVTSIAFLVPFSILARWNKLSLKQALPAGKPTEKGVFWPIILMGLAVCAFSNITTNFAGRLFEDAGVHYEASIHSSAPKGFFALALAFLSTAVFPALLEEFAMRGVLLGSLRRYGDGFALVVSSAVFSLMHGNFEQIPFSFILGLYMAFAVIKTGTIWSGVLLHFINNAMTVVLQKLSVGLSNQAVQMLTPAYFLVLILLGFCGVWLLRRKDCDFFTLSRPKEMLLEERQKYGAFATAPLVIICLVVVFIEAAFVYAV